MLTILVADDRKLIRKGVAKILEASDIEISRIIECVNGEDALEGIIKNEVDIVITDIRMPRMDGITMMGRAAEAKKIPKFIVLSGYNDFQYAKECINYGAKAYILKPVDRDELVNTVKKVLIEIKREEDSRSIEERAGTMERKLMEDELRLALLTDMEETTQYRNKLMESFVNSGFVLLLLGEKRSDAALAAADYAALRQRIRDFFLERGRSFLDLNMGRTVLVIVDREEEARELVGYVNAGGSRYFGAAESCRGDFEGLRKYYLQVSEAFKYRYVFPDSDLVWYEGIISLNEEDTPEKKQISKLSEIMGTERISSLDDILSGLFDRQLVSSRRISFLENTVKAVYEALGAVACVLPPKWLEKIKGYDTLKDVYSYESVREYLKHLKEYMTVLNSHMLSARELCRDKSEIEEAIEYIHMNYNRELTLTMISNRVSLNYSYFSHAFKERTGMSFIEYLRKVRIDRSKVLLTDTRWKIFEIAKEVGFDNYKHFARAFKEVVGITPQEYRDKGSMNNSAN